MTTCNCGGPIAPTSPGHPADAFCVRCGTFYTDGQTTAVTSHDIADAFNAQIAADRAAWS